MATITARGTLILANSGIFTNPSNITDTSDTTYGTVSVPKASSKDFVIGGFDLSAIPDGSTINSFALKSYVGLDSNLSCMMYATRHYVSGAFNNVGVTSQKAFGSANTLEVNTVSETAPFTVFAGFSAEDINQKWTDASDYTGIAFYIRYKNSSSSVLGGSSSAHPRYFDLTVDYTLPKVTIATSASPAEGGMVTGGGTYEIGSSITVTATPNEGYVFSDWLINEIAMGNSDPTLTVTSQANATITAVFEKLETSKVYKGTRKQSVYCGNKKQSVYIGTNKIS